MFHRQLIARLLRLPPAQHAVAVERNLRVPTPDGIALATDHYFPKAAGSFPTILIRTPYGRGPSAGPSGVLLSVFPGQRFAERGYHVVIQDTRGRYDSEGEFNPSINEAADGCATLNWIARQPWFNGSLGMWGRSYVGYVQWAVVEDAPPHFKAMTASVTSSQFFTSNYPDGAFAFDAALQWAFQIYETSRRARRPLWQRLLRNNPLLQKRFLAPAYRHLPLLEADTVAAGEPVPAYRELYAHTRPDDLYWKTRDHSVSAAQTTIPVHLLSGWYDLLQRETLADYARLKAAGRLPYLTIGPWPHTDLAWLGEELRQGLAWFNAHLKNDHGLLRTKPVRLYVMGAAPNGRSGEWREIDDWPPPATATRFYLHAQRCLSTDAPETGSSPDHYRYDPADPTPALAGPVLALPAGPTDNRALEARPDVLTYTTPPLSSDVEVIGPVRLELYATSSLPYTDFFGRLCDVHPDGRSINICDGLFRVEPGKGDLRQPDGSLRIEVDLWATAMRFRRGHRLRLQVSSGAHPRWNRNLGTGEPVGTGTRMVAADQTIYHDRAHPSALVLPVVAGFNP